jgi:uncharacterized protein YdaU (DUF1376 family)
MTKKADTWMPWYVADYLADTAHLTTEQHGAYCLMLMAAWKGGGALPNEDGQLAAVCRLTPARWRASRAILLRFFSEDGEQIVHKRVTAERQKAQSISDKKAKNGKEGASARWQTDSKPMANAIENGRQTDAPSPSPTHSPSENSEPKGSGGKPPKEDLSPDAILFGYGVPYLVEAGSKEANARSFIGKLRKLHGDNVVIEKLRACLKLRPSQPIEWLAAALPPEKAPQQVEWHETQSGIEGMGETLGLGRWDEATWKARGFNQADSFAAYKARVMTAHRQGVH